MLNEKLMSERNIVTSLSKKLQNDIDKELWEAIKQNRLDKVIEVLNEGASTTVTDEFLDTALNLACKSNKNEEIQYDGADIAVQIVEKLLSRNPDAVHTRNIMGNTPLMTAVIEKKNLKIVEILLQAGSNPNTENNLRYFPIISASVYKNMKLLDLLLRYGASPFVKDRKGETPMDFIKETNPKYFELINKKYA